MCKGGDVVVDVNGVIGGLNKQNPKDFGNEIVCNISKPEIMELAKKEGVKTGVSPSRAQLNKVQNSISLTKR